VGNSKFHGSFLSVSGLWLHQLTDLQVESTLAIEFALDVSDFVILTMYSMFTDFQGACKPDARELPTPP
jgi:hypothetical protein